MSTLKIWHNPRCRKSREGLQYLQDKGLSPEIYLYLQETIDSVELASLIESSGQPLKEFIRSNEKEFKELGLKGKDLNAGEFAKYAAQYPKLLQRPIVINQGKVVLARPVEKIDDIL